MRQSERKRRKIVIGALCSVLLLMAVGYAAFAANLNIKGSTNISSSWDVRITNITSKNVVGGASNLEAPSYTNLTATFKTNLVSPGDSIEYDITVTNNGNIDAILDKITITDSNNPAIIFTKSGLTEGATLLASESKVLTVKVEYSNSVTSQPESTESSIEVTLDLSQNDGHIVTPSTFTGIVYRWEDGVNTEASLNIGDSIEGIETTTDYTKLRQNSFLKHSMKDGKVESSEACFIKDGNTYCLKPNEYETSKAKLLEIFGESVCVVDDSHVSCVEKPVAASANSDGSVQSESEFFLHKYVNSNTCMVDSSGNSSFGYSWWDAFGY